MIADCLTHLKRILVGGIHLEEDLLMGVFMDDLALIILDVAGGSQEIKELFDAVLLPLRNGQTPLHTHNLETHFLHLGLNRLHLHSVVIC